MIDSDDPDRPDTGCGAVLLVVGVILVWVLVWEGIALARADEPKMGHVTHVAATLMVGPLAVLMILAGLHLRRRRRD